MPDARELLQYDEDLNVAVEDGSSDVFYNDSILHAFIIMKHLLKKAQKEEQKQIRIFCGNFSLFRDETKRKIQKEKNGYSLDKLTDKEIEKWHGWDLFGELQNELRTFLNQEGAKLHLIMMRGISSLRDNEVWEILKTGIDNNKLFIYSLDAGLKIDHFAVTSDAYRVENSDLYKKATCCFGDRKGADILNSNFDILLRYSSKVYPIESKG